MGQSLAALPRHNQVTASISFAPLLLSACSLRSATLLRSNPLLAPLYSVAPLRSLALLYYHAPLYSISQLARCALFQCSLFVPLFLLARSALLQSSSRLFAPLCSITPARLLASLQWMCAIRYTLLRFARSLLSTYRSANRQSAIL